MGCMVYIDGVWLMMIIWYSVVFLSQNFLLTLPVVEGWFQGLSWKSLKVVILDHPLDHLNYWTDSLSITSSPFCEKERQRPGIAIVAAELFTSNNGNCLSRFAQPSIPKEGRQYVGMYMYTCYCDVYTHGVLDICSLLPASNLINSRFNLRLPDNASNSQQLITHGQRTSLGLSSLCNSSICLWWLNLGWS